MLIKHGRHDKIDKITQLNKYINIVFNLSMQNDAIPCSIKKKYKVDQIIYIDVFHKSFFSD